LLARIFERREEKKNGSEKESQEEEEVSFFRKVLNGTSGMQQCIPEFFYGKVSQLPLSGFTFRVSLSNPHRESFLRRPVRRGQHPR
jgi:hypothetical protein